MSLEIYFLTWDYHPLKAGGAERYVRNMSQALQNLGHSVGVITRHHYTTTCEEKIDGVPVYRIDCLSWFADRMLEYFPPPSPGKEEKYLWLKYIPVRGIAGYMQKLLFMKRAKKFILSRKSPRSVVIIPMLDWLAGWASICLQTKGIPAIGRGATAHCFSATTNRSIPFKQKIEAGRKQMSSYIALTSEMKIYMKTEGISEERISIIPNGVKIPEQFVDAGNYYDVLCVANFTQGIYKGFDTLFQAWKLVSSEEKNARLILVGHGDAMPYIKMAKCDCTKDRIVIAGHSDSVEKFYMSAGIFVLSSRSEGMSNALLEAQSFGIPAVVTDIPGNKAVVIDGHNGFIVPVDDSIVLANKLQELLRNTDLRRKMGQTAIRIIREKFNIADLAIKTEELCYDVTNRFAV